MGVCIRNPDTDEPTGEEVDLVDAVVVGGDDEGIKLQLRDGRYLDVTGDSEFRGGSSEWLYFSFGSAPLDIVPKTTRIIRVTSCAECPHAIGSRRCRKSPYIDEHGCHLLREFDPDEFPRIPAWCPLEEAPAFVAHGPIQNNRKRNGVKMCKLSLVCPVCGWRQEVDLDDYLEIVQTPGHPYTCGNEECPVIHAEMVPEDEEIYEFKKRMDKLNREMAAVDEQLAAIHAETAPKLCSKCGRELTEVLEPSTRRTVLVCIPCLLNQKDQIITLKKDLEAPPGRRWGDMPVDLSSLIINEICGNCACSNADDPTGGDYCYRYQSTIGDLTPDQVIFCRHFEQQMEERGP